MFRYFLLYAFLIIVHTVPTPAGAQVAIVRLTAYYHGTTPLSSPIFVTGSFNGWRTADSLYRLHPSGHNTYSIILPLFDGVEYDYKYTLGSWETEELSVSDSKIDNRRLLSVNRKKIRDTIVQFKTKNTSTAAPSIQAQKLDSMKNVVLARLQPDLDSMQRILKLYVTNALLPQPDHNLKAQLDQQVSKNVSNVLVQVADLLVNVLQMLEPLQKEKMLEAFNSMAGEKDFFNTFLKQMEGVKF